jgi:exonuclease III
MQLYLLPPVAAPGNGRAPLLLGEVAPTIKTSNVQPGGPRSPPGDVYSDRSPPTSSSDEEHYETNEVTMNIFGDRLEHTKSPFIFRGISLQLGCLPVDQTDPKYETLVKAILDRNLDVVTMQEVGINFSHANSTGQWKNRIGWNTWLNGHRAKTVNAWNSQDHHRGTRNMGLQQYGGTAILSLGKTSFYAAGSGTDPKRMGRWCWTRYQGKHNLTLRVISFYRPCASNSPGEHTVTATQERCMRLTNDNRSARQAFLDDFRDAINEWKAEGDALIICGDINENIQSQAVTSYFEDLGLRKDR